MLLNHVNVYTGVANKDNPTIMSWETGNELSYGLGGAAEFTKWTSTISAYIKSIAPNQLVMDGSLGMDPGDLKLADVDIENPHFYPLNTALLSRRREPDGGRRQGARRRRVRVERRRPDIVPVSHPEHPQHQR